MRRQPLIVGLVMAMAMGASTCAVSGSGTSGSSTGVAVQVTAVVPYWNAEPGAETVRAHARAVTTSSPWLLGLDDETRIVHMTGQETELDDAAAAARDSGMRFQPTIANYSDHAWRHAGIRRTLHDPALRAAHVSAITDLADRGDWDGVTIDYEGLAAGDRAVFTAFVEELASALHDGDRRLAVDVYAKTDADGTDQAHRSQDLAALGAAADELRLMAYTYSWETSPPGPIASPDWVEAAIRYTLTQVPADKVVLGIPLFGFDWPHGGSATPVSWRDVESLLNRHRPQVDTDHGTPHFRYDSDGDRGMHEVWFETACTSFTKLALAEKYHLAGVFLWLYGPEDPGLWPALAGQPPKNCGAAEDGARVKRTST